MTDEKAIRIVDAVTGEVRFSAPMRRHAPSRQGAGAASIQGNAPVPPSPDAPSPVAAPAPPMLLASPVPAYSLTGSDAAVPGVAFDPTEGEPKATGKGKADIETLEQFIAQAYGLKGRKVSLKQKVERAIAAAVRLSDDAQLRLLRLAQEDRLLAVPRQLLLTSREIQDHPLLRAALRNFVRDVMLGHAIFKRPALAAAIHNLPDAPTVAQALAMVLEELGPATDGVDDQAMKPGELDELRTNAAYCLGVWFADTRNISLSELTEALNFALWAPRAKQVERDNTRLRALTEIEQVVGVGLACHQFRQQAADRAVQADHAAREAATAKELAAGLESTLRETLAELSKTKGELEHVQRESEATINALRTAAHNESTHLRDDFEQMRTRVLRRLVADVDQLEVGLSALRGPEARVHVIQDRVERVVDALRAEVNRLKGE